MMWKAIVFAFLVAAVFANANELSDDGEEQILHFLRTQCSKAGAPDKADEAINTRQEYIDCTKQLVDIEQLKIEIKAARSNGNLNKVLKKHCAKAPRLKTCVHSLIDGLTPCISVSDHEQYEYNIRGKNITDHLIDFLCFKDGGRIALFITEHGADCVGENKNDLIDCAVKTMKALTSVDVVLSWSIAEQCAQYDALSFCVLNALEQCSSPIPGNIAESLHRYVRKGFLCDTA